MKKFLVLPFVFIFLPILCFGWGREGHQIIATVAEDHLDESTKVMIQSLIGNNHLYSVASWADDVRKERRETAPWHYVDIRLGSTYEASLDCPLPHSCVVAKIDEFLKVMTDENASHEIGHKFRQPANHAGGAGTAMASPNDNIDGGAGGVAVLPFSPSQLNQIKSQCDQYKKNPKAYTFGTGGSGVGYYFDGLSWGFWSGGYWSNEGYESWGFWGWWPTPHPQPMHGL